VKTVASEMTKYSLDLVAIQEVRRNEGGNHPAEGFCGNGNANVT